MTFKTSAIGEGKGHSMLRCSLLIWSRFLLLIALLPGLGEGENLHIPVVSNEHGRDMRSTNPYQQRPPGEQGFSSAALNRKLPYFRSHGQTYRIKEGESVTMTCVVENLGNSVIVWKQTDRIISAGSRMIRKDSRMKIIREMNGISLRINQVNPNDQGEYICELETYGDPIDQINKLDVLVPPKISLLNPANKLSVRKGSAVSLGCNATGFPQPRITWERKYQMLPTGEKVKEGSHLVIQNVSRLDSGSYICTAANGVEKAVEKEIDLKVIYEPEIKVDKAWVHADLEVEVKISCLVFAEPKAEVRWYRETMLLAQNENRMVEQYGERHSLILYRAQESDFGNYSCSAENQLGKSKAFIEVSGQPNKANISSRSLSFFSDRYNLTWSVFSYSKVTQYRILFRKVVPKDDLNYSSRSRWHNVIPSLNKIVSFKADSGHLQRGSYTFYALEPSSQYEVVIQSQNRWGWSRNSNPFFFSTRAIDFSPKVDASQPKGSRQGDENVEDSSDLNSSLSSSSSSSSSSKVSSTSTSSVTSRASTTTTTTSTRVFALQNFFYTLIIHILLFVLKLQPNNC